MIPEDDGLMLLGLGDMAEKWIRYKCFISVDIDDYWFFLTYLK